MTVEPTPAGAPPADVTPASTPAPAQPSNEQKSPAPSAAEPAEQAKTEPGQPSAETQDEGQGEKDEQSKPKSRFQERIDRLTAEKRAAEARAAAAEARLKKYVQPIEIPPDISFEEQEELRLQKVLRRQQAESAEEEVQQERSAAVDRRRQMFEAKVESVADRMPDLVQKFSAVPCSDFAADFISESDRGAEIAYYLGSNPHEAIRLAGLPDTRQAIELARLETRLNAAPQVRKISQAPTPPPMVGGGTAAPGPKDPAEMTDAEYSAWYAERQKKARR